MADGEKFQIVDRRKRGKRSTRVIRDKNIFENNIETDFNVDLFIRKLAEAKNEIRESEFKKNVFQNINKSLDILKTSNINELVCYGLGHFFEHKHCRYQLALLLLIKDHFKASVHIYDPLFSNREIDFLKTVDCQIIDENEEGKRRVESTALIYLPHCPKQLTNNFLYANWGPDLKNCILFSNSFGLILESHTSAVLNNSARYIVRINPFVEEIKLHNSFKYQNVFNDSAIHIFPQDKLKDIGKSFWEDKEEPKYLDKDIEFISSSISKKLTI